MSAEAAKASQLAEPMVAASKMLNTILRQRAIEACPDESDRWPFSLSVLETLLATYVAMSAPPDELEERIELTLRHVAWAARSMAKERRP